MGGLLLLVGLMMIVYGSLRNERRAGQVLLFAGLALTSFAVVGWGPEMVAAFEQGYAHGAQDAGTEEGHVHRVLRQAGRTVARLTETWSTAAMASFLPG